MSKRCIIVSGNNTSETKICIKPNETFAIKLNTNNTNNVNNLDNVDKVWGNWSVMQTSPNIKFLSTHQDENSFSCEKNNISQYWIWKAKSKFSTNKLIYQFKSGKKTYYSIYIIQISD